MLRNVILQPATSLEFAKKLRKRQTRGEKILWKKLRASRFHGFKFRRQVPVGPYIVDFLCVDRKLVIEIDGDTHYELGAQKRDRKRESYLKSQGFSVIRFGNWQTIERLDFVLATIGKCLGCYSD